MKKRPLSRPVAAFPQRGTTLAAGETPATAFRDGLLRGPFSGLLRSPLFGAIFRLMS